MGPFKGKELEMEVGSHPGNISGLFAASRMDKNYV